MPGSPIIYYGDELGMGDNILLDDRDGVRTPMQWNQGKHAGFSDADQTYSPVISEPPFDPANVNVVNQQADLASMYYMIKNMVAVRKTHRAFGWGDFVWATVSNPKQIAAYFRTFEGENLLIVNNLSSSNQKIFIDIPTENIFFPPPNLFTGKATGELADGQLRLELPPFGYEWLKLS
jgi:maltose alpha-D-glucosyltransferase/alpha-amylase